MTAPYLPPAMRPLKSEQIGLSSHKNTYSRGVLENNWCEERGASETAANDRSFRADTTHRAEFTHKFDDPSVGTSLRANVEPQQPMPREHLFGHGADVTVRSLVTTKELTHDLKFKTATAFDAAGEPVRSDLLERKRRQWEAERDHDAFATTHGTSYDEVALADAARQRLAEKESGAKKWGELTRAQNADYLRTGLRSGVAASRSPMCAKGEII